MELTLPLVMNFRKIGSHRYITRKKIITFMYHNGEFKFVRNGMLEYISTTGERFFTILRNIF